MDLASVVAALASVGVRVSGSTPNNNIQEDSSRACPTGLAGPEPSGTHNDPGQHFHAHPGIRKTLEIFNRKYSCAYQRKELHQMVQSIVNKCNICGQTKGRKGLQPESDHPAPVPEYPFASVCVDFCDLSGLPCTANGNTYDYVLVVVCRLTGYVVAVPCSKTLTALGLVDLYMERVVPVMGMP